MNIIGEFRNFFKLISNGNPEEIRGEELDPRAVLEGIEGLTNEQKSIINEAWQNIEQKTKNLGEVSKPNKSKFIKVEKTNIEKYIPVQRNIEKSNDERAE